MNRSHPERGKSTDRELEKWVGTVLPRERSYCVITREQETGTPKVLVLEQGDTRAGRIVSMYGSSVEAVERWGPGNTLASGIYLERTADDFNYENDMPQIDPCFDQGFAQV